jgi:hypothetical protein
MPAHQPVNVTVRSAGPVLPGDSVRVTVHFSHALPPPLTAHAAVIGEFRVNVDAINPDLLPPSADPPLSAASNKRSAERVMAAPRARDTRRFLMSDPVPCRLWVDGWMEMCFFFFFFFFFFVF